MYDPITRLNAALEGRYSIERELGEGGMATVYLADDLKHERKVALKVLKPELAAVVGAERFLAEIKTTANLQHPHILPLFDSGEADSFLFYVMPYVEGESLREKLDREHQLPVEKAVRIATNLAEALDYAHRQGVIHRDIKPANVLLQAGKPVISDFGIALAVGVAGGGRLTETGLSLGTPNYMSPEQATGDRNIDPRSDVYALGCVLYEMLVGDPPYTASNAQAVLAKILTEDARAPSTVRASIPPNVDAAIRKALEKLPADRFGSGEDFAEALDQTDFRHGESVPSSPGVRSRSGRRLIVALASLNVLLIGVLAWEVSRPEPARGVLRYTLAVPMEDGMPNDYGINFALAPDGSRIAFSSARGGLPQLWVRERDSLEARVVYGSDDAHSPFFSPDGRSVGVITNRFDLKILSLDGDAPRTVVVSGAVRGGGHWGRDGYIYFGSTDFDVRGAPMDSRQGIRRVSENGGELQILTEVDKGADEVRHLFPQVVPSGKGVVFSIEKGRFFSPETMQIAVVRVGGGTPKVLTPGVVARATESGHLLVVRADGMLLAAPFDDDRLQLTGSTVPLNEHVGVERFATADLAISAAGTLMYGTRGVETNLRELVWVTRDGAARAVESGWSGYFATFALSPNGTSLAVGVVEDFDERVHIKDLLTGSFTRLTFEGTRNQVLGWSSDGQKIRYEFQDGNVRRIAERRADHGGGPVVLFEESRRVGRVTFSPDATVAVYHIESDGESDIVIRDVGADTDARDWLATSSYEGQPAMSPNGRWLAYVSDKAGQRDVYLRHVSDETDEGVPVSTGGGTYPEWSRNGRELFYLSPNHLVAVEVVPAETFQTGGQVQLFEVSAYGPQFAVGPQGQRFLMTRSRPGVKGFEQMIVVENFFEVLKRLVPN